jgi:glycine/D-amino acid oxidase-like deaminating enzyme/nitrite reductase/ring-hydroxylating ferredoxin subunit
MKSIWQQSISIEKRTTLDHTISTDIAIIGAGMTGILLADMLKSAGKEVVVLEAERIGSGQTAGTTAKITSQHGLKYQYLLEHFGKDKANLYAKSQNEAISRYALLIRDRKIDCDWKEVNAYLYSCYSKEQLIKETEAAKTLGISAHFTEKTDLPIPIKGAVCFEKQAIFHPLSFLDAIAKNITIYEKTPVLTVNDNTLHTPQGNVTANHIVFACHFPFVNFPGWYFTRMHQERSLVLSLKNVPQFTDMFYGIDANGISLRPVGENLLFGGEGYRTGEGGEGRYDALEKTAKEWFPQCTVTTKWSAQDCIAARKIPYIGYFSQKHLNWYVATGYGKWGMTSSMVAADILRDLICGKENPFETLYSPDEFAPVEFSQILSDGCKTVKNLISHSIPGKSKNAIQKEQGGKFGWGKGGYRDAHLQLHTVTLKCPHLGCKLHWNKDEKTWDCPCHGSRFDKYGKKISGPAQEDITL